MSGFVGTLGIFGFPVCTLRKNEQKGQTMSQKVKRSRLVTYRASAINPDTGERDVWDVYIQANRREDRADWEIMANEAGFTEISLTKVVPPKSDKKNETGTPRNPRMKPKVDKAEIARAGLALLDSILAARKGQSG